MNRLRKFLLSTGFLLVSSGIAVLVGPHPPRTAVAIGIVGGLSFCGGMAMGRP